MTAQTIGTAKSEKSQFASVMTTGFALFSMFFGAGNLIFPLIIGKITEGNWGYAIAGLAITAVIVPFLGLAGMIFYEADCKKFLGRIGYVPGLILLLLLQVILGPVGVIPRLFTLMHAILKPYMFDIPLLAFSIGAGLVVFFCSFKQRNLIKILGAVLTPILLISLCCLFISGFIYRSEIPSYEVLPWDSFMHGLLGGYNTMDLIAAFLFATVVLPHFRHELTEENQERSKEALFRKVYLTSFVAAGLLLLTYIGICFISCYHGSLVNVVAPEELLGAIAVRLLGPVGGFVSAIAIVTACLTTAITLSLIFAKYVKTDLCKDKIDSTTSLVITLAIATVFANFGFTGIAKFLGPILEISYPGLIVLTLVNILHYFTGFKPVKTPVYLTFLISAIVYLY